MSLLRECGTSRLIRKCGTATLLRACPSGPIEPPVPAIECDNCTEFPSKLFLTVTVPGNSSQGCYHHTDSLGGEHYWCVQMFSSGLRIEVPWLTSAEYNRYCWFQVTPPSDWLVTKMWVANDAECQPWYSEGGQEFPCEDDHFQLAFCKLVDIFIGENGERSCYLDFHQGNNPNALWRSKINFTPNDCGPGIETQNTTLMTWIETDNNINQNYGPMVPISATLEKPNVV
jgi:hypothetical protein